MAHCRVCMAEISWGILEDGTKVPLDERETRDEGPDRYRIVTFAETPKIEPVSEQTPRRAMVDHRAICRQPRVI